MKKITFLFLVLFVGLWSILASADVKLKYSFSQNATYARHTDLNKMDDNNPIATRGNTTSALKRGQNSGDAYSFFSSLLGVNAVWTPLSTTEVMADLVAQFDWHGSNGTTFPNQSASPGQALGTYNGGITSGIGFGFKELNLKFTDFLDFPIDLKVGRQDIKLGRGFVVDSWLVGAGPTPYVNGIGPSGSGTSNADGVPHDGQNTQVNTGNLPIN